MTTIPDLITEAKGYVEVTNPEFYENHLVRSLADALEDQQKTLDAETAAHDDTLRERDRFHSAIREALALHVKRPRPSLLDCTCGPSLLPCQTRRILTEALEGTP